MSFFQQHKELYVICKKKNFFFPVHLLVRVRAEDGRPPDDVYDLAGDEEGDSEAEGGQGADLGGLRTEGEAAADELLAEVGQQRDAVCGRKKRFFSHIRNRRCSV